MHHLLRVRFVLFVLDGTDQRLHDILERRHTDEVGVFVQYEGHVDAAALHQPSQSIESHGLGNEDRLTHELLQRSDADTLVNELEALRTQGLFGLVGQKCGILLFSLFGLGGNATFALIFAASLLLVLSGLGLWLTFRKPSNETSKKAVQACIFLVAVTLLALLTALPRLWGLTVFFDAFALIVTGVIIVEFILFPH